MRLGASLLFSFALAGFMALPSSAGTIQLGINGDAQVGSNYIDFGQYPTGAPYTPAPGYGTFEVSLVNAGVFSSAGVTTGEFGTIQSLNEPPGAVTLPSAFMTFDTGGSNLQLWATEIVPADSSLPSCIATPACGAGPFDISQAPNGMGGYNTTASFGIDGYVWDTNTNTKVDTFIGSFTQTFANTTIAELYGEIPVDTPYAATFTATTIPTIPEPASMLLMGAGLLGVGLVARRKARRS